MSRRSPTNRASSPAARAVVAARAQRLLGWLVVKSTLAIVTCALLPGCVVTTAPSYNDQPDCPPSFIPSEADPPVNVPKTIFANDPTAEFVGTVALRSCAVTKTYAARYFLDGNIFKFGVIDPTGDTTRSTTFHVPFLNVAPGCHRVELLATTAFLATEFRTPQTQGDLAYIVWFVDVKDGASGSSSTLASCPQ